MNMVMVITWVKQDTGKLDQNRCIILGCIYIKRTAIKNELDEYYIPLCVKDEMVYLYENFHPNWQFPKC